MAETELQLKRLAKPKISYLAYFLAKTFFSALTSCELYYFSAFMTDGCLYAAGIAATVMSITSTVDFVFCFFTGTVIETIRLPWGKNRSWLLVGPPLALIFTLLMFSKFFDDNSKNAIIVTIGFIVGHIFWSIAESAWGSVALSMSDIDAERNNIGMWGGRGSLCATFVFGLISTPLLAFFENTGASSHAKYTWCVLIIGILYVASFWYLFIVTRGCEETKKDREAAGKAKEKPQLGKAIKGIPTRDFIGIFIGVFCQYGSTMIQSAVMFYFFSWAFGGTYVALFGTVMTLISLTKFVGIMLSNIWLKIFKGKIKLMYAFGHLFVCIFLAIAYIFFRMNTFAPCLTCVFLGGFLGSSMQWAGQQPMFMQAAIHGSYKVGYDCSSFIMALMNLPVKVAILLRSYITGALLVAIGYDATNTDPAAAVRYGNGFALGYLGIAAIYGIVGFIAVMLLFKMTPQRAEEMQLEIVRRREAAAKQD